MNDYNKYVQQLKSEFESHQDGDLFPISQEEVLIYLYSYYHYIGASYSDLNKIIDADIYEDNSPDHIGAIFIDSDSENDSGERDVDIIVTKYYQDTDTLNIDEVIKLLQETSSYIAINAPFFKDSRDKLKDLMSDDDYRIDVSKNGKRNINIVFLTNFKPTNKKQLTSFKKKISNIKSKVSQIQYSAIFYDDIEEEIGETESPMESVQRAEFTLDRPNNYLEYGSEESLIVNISAKSLQRVYDRYSNAGLFAQNLRYYVKSAKVDGGIVDSAQNNSKEFWYLNNGIIVICSDYIIEDDKIILKDFSIINGGQTTKLIGETEFDNDFFIQCKVIKSSRCSNEDDRLEFISKVAEASNTQKPIKGKDLIANKPEQRKLKSMLAQNHIFCSIKRGEKVNKRVYNKDWQITNNEEIGQFLLAFMYQKPGTARSQKASICDNAEYYARLFKKEYSPLLIKDLLILKIRYKEWTKKIAKESKEAQRSLDNMEVSRSKMKDGLVKNGMFFFSAMIGVISKFMVHPDYVGKFSPGTLEERLRIISQYDIYHSIFNDGENQPKEKFYQLFEWLYTEIMQYAFENYTGTGYSNFTKTDNNYSTYVLRELWSSIRKLSDSDKNMFSSLFYIPTEDEEEINNELLETYANPILPENKTMVQVDTSIANDLRKLRKEKASQLKVKDVELFSDAAVYRIATSIIKTQEDLKNLNCLDKKALILCGDDILKIVKRHRFYIGDRVYSPYHGEGVVRAITDGKDGRTISVYFPQKNSTCDYGEYSTGINKIVD